jgi:alpha-mannosidase/mannosylglycerate hydrolase
VLRLSSLKPAESGDGLIVRLLNPSDREITAVIRAGLGVAAASLVRLDETPTDDHLEAASGEVRLAVPPHALRSVRLLLRTNSPRR